LMFMLVMTMHLDGHVVVVIFILLSIYYTTQPMIYNIQWNIYSAWFFDLEESTMENSFTVQTPP